ncbi:hypothetical protein [Pseudoduganella buxea]|uniref:Uncharacterized protein n=1 Tax=Pseudoduganella buxea TaxID=1949069 RepID=A0A6I3T1D7_9BURK|nr:hypothetical protein [Pseudoduganella buxea]MTV55154.1 hypothetical protein [Pseudoduganella buxea]GGB84223.1 hypothetical protein GCM10011572_02690 [Pseudoduganella buxea]
MEIDEYAAVRTQCLTWLTRLTGEQGDGLRRLFERCVSLADCLAIIEDRGARMRCCPHCTGDKNWLIRFHGVASRYLPHYLGWIHGLDCRHLSTPQQFLRAALFPAGT